MLSVAQQQINKQTKQELTVTYYLGRKAWHTRFKTQDLISVSMPPNKAATYLNFCIIHKALARK